MNSVKVIQKDAPVETFSIRKGTIGGVYIIVSIPDDWTSKPGDVVVRGNTEMVSLRTRTYSSLEQCNGVIVRELNVQECVEITRVS